MLTASDDLLTMQGDLNLDGGFAAIGDGTGGVLANSVLNLNSDLASTANIIAVGGEGDRVTGDPPLIGVNLVVITLASDQANRLDKSYAAVGVSGYAATIGNAFRDDSAYFLTGLDFRAYTGTFGDNTEATNMSTYGIRCFGIWGFATLS